MQFRSGSQATPRLAILTAGDARNPRTWSGTPYYMTRALEDHFGQAEIIGSLQPHMLKALKAVNKITSRVTGTQSLPAQSWRLARHYGREAGQRLSTVAADVIVAPAGSALVAALETDLPIVYSSDATAKLMFDYYPQFKNLSSKARREVDQLERCAIEKASLILYPTQWAAQSAVEDYGADPSRVHVLPYGANLEQAPSREAALAPRERSNGYKLLFVGVNWAIKGGDIAVEAFRELKRSGMAVELTIVGCSPPQPIDEPGLTIIPFLDKNDPEQRIRLSELYLDADVLILPTRCECYGIVFCEASAHGVPSVATATGGVPDVVRSGVNGMTLPLSATGADYAQAIRALLDDPDKHRALRESSRNEYENCLNWRAWGVRAASLIQELVVVPGTRTA